MGGGLGPGGRCGSRAAASRRRLAASWALWVALGLLCWGRSGGSPCQGAGGSTCLFAKTAGPGLPVTACRLQVAARLEERAGRRLPHRVLLYVQGMSSALRRTTFPVGWEGAVPGGQAPGCSAPRSASLWSPSLPPLLSCSLFVPLLELWAQTAPYSGARAVNWKSLGLPFAVVSLECVNAATPSRFWWSLQTRGWEEVWRSHTGASPDLGVPPPLLPR